MGIKNFILILIILSTMTHIMACSGSDTIEGEETVQSNGAILITYFSYPEPDGVDVSTGASRLIKEGAVSGHVEFLAKTIWKATGADLFEIRTVQQYPASHEPLIAQAREEQNTGARPALATYIENIDDYDIIFIGYPNWWGDLPMPLYTFLEEYDLKGKTIIPFNSNGGSGLSSTVNTIMSKQPGAVVVKAFTVSRNSVGDAENDVLNWLKEIEATK